MKWLDLFSGVGMYALGLEQAGHEVIGFCERETFCQRILKKHWPTKPISSSIELLNHALGGVLGSSEDSLAKTSPSPIPPIPKDLMVNEVDFGVTYLKPFAWYDRSKRLWRTWQHCLIEEWAEFSETWPKSGMIHNGIAYTLPTLVCHMRGKGYISLRTPCASDSKGTSRKRYLGSPSFVGGRLTEFLRTSPTDMTYTHPNFAEAMMGLEKDYTLLETETLPASSENLQGG